jgi:hypothetical protein
MTLHKGLKACTVTTEAEETQAVEWLSHLPETVEPWSPGVPLMPDGWRNDFPPHPVSREGDDEHPIQKMARKMTWILLIQILTVTTCQEGFTFCPPAKPPVSSQQVFASEKACQLGLGQFRQRFPERREVLRSEHMVMEQHTTLRCVPQPQG